MVRKKQDSRTKIGCGNCGGKLFKCYYGCIEKETYLKPVLVFRCINFNCSKEMEIELGKFPTTKELRAVQ